MADDRLNDLTPVEMEALEACPSCNELDDARSDAVRYASTVVISLPVLLVVLDFIAKAAHIPWQIDDKILGTSLAGVAWVLAFGYKRKKD